MAVFFGTDGIRGKVNEDLNYDLAFKCGNALSSYKKNPIIIIGRDTRISGSYITLAFSCGAMTGGAKVIDVGVCPTAGISYLTKELKADFGVVISASHNPYEYNGIKIFDSTGYKLGDKQESLIEKKFISTHVCNHINIGSFKQKTALVNLYTNYLMSLFDVNLKNLKIVLDCSNGASYKIAPYIFKKLGAKVVKVACSNNGFNINNNCGSLYPENLKKYVLKHKADIGFAFDGDSDRILACSCDGKILDGDDILFILSKYFKEKNMLKSNTVVGTSHTNMGIEKTLKNLDINLIKVDIGDKYVIEKLCEQNLNLGGEKSGHIILKDYAQTGDGVLTALFLSKILSENKNNFNNYYDVELYPQLNENVVVKDKMRVINSEKLSECINAQEKLIGENSRIMVRVSGTEPKIRIMVESLNTKQAKESLNAIKQVILQINSGD